MYQIASLGANTETELSDNAWPEDNLQHRPISPPPHFSFAWTHLTKIQQLKFQTMF